MTKKGAPQRALTTVAELRTALAELPPNKGIYCDAPPFDGVVLVESGGKILIRSPKPGKEGK